MSTSHHHASSQYLLLIYNTPYFDFSAFVNSSSRGHG